MASDAFDPHAELIPASRLSEPPRAPFLIVGLTQDQRTFRPSDWADRLAGVMSSFQPAGLQGDHRLQVSPYAVPARHAGISSVRVDPAIARIEPMALTFLLNFARDNSLMLVLTSGDS
ncbi:MAG: DUF3579 domain-containing protein [Burkholderiaceae bacterium]